MAESPKSASDILRELAASEDEQLVFYQPERDALTRGADACDGIAALLRFQYLHQGMGVYACGSCGARAHREDDCGGRWKAEACSRNCPWGRARALVERG